jgi:hypothetical protein
VVASELLEVALKVLRGEEDNRFNAQKRFPELKVPSRRVQLGLEFLRLEVSEVERVLECPGSVSARPFGMGDICF